MGTENSKLERPNANVINEVNVAEDPVNLSQIKICLTILTILACLSFALKLYSMHNRILKKKYLSQGNSPDKI